VGLRIDARDAAWIARSTHGTNGTRDAGYDMPNGYGAYDDSAGDDASYNNGDDSDGSDDAYDYDEKTGQPLPFAWLMTYPNDDPRQPPRQPKVILRSLHANRRRMEFEIACLIGYWHRDHKRLSDPDAPTGSI